MSAAALRSGMLTYIAPVLRIADLARAVAYYRDLLGFVQPASE